VSSTWLLVLAASPPDSRQGRQPSAAGSNGRRPHRPYLIEVLAAPGPGDAEADGDGFAGLAGAASGGDFAVSSGVRLRLVHTLPEGKVTPDAAPA
jgi:hypothetical protein